jgi:hypothetical protein
MTIITESLISECQSRNAICLNETLNIAYQETLSQVIDLNLDFDSANKDIQKIIKHNLIIQLCELKKTIPQKTYLYIKREEYNENYLKIVDEITSKMELYKAEKSANFLRSFNNYLKKNGFKYISSVYLKQVSNKLALFR